MKHLLTLLLLPLILISCNHTDPWTKQDKILEGTYLTLHTMDWMQTRSTDWKNSSLEEKNPILGESPSKTKTDVYFLVTGLLHVGITYVIPQKYRPYWQALTIGVEATTVGNNFSVGMRLGF